MVEPIQTEMGWIPRYQVQVDMLVIFPVSSRTFVAGRFRSR